MVKTWVAAHFFRSKMYFSVLEALAFILQWLFLYILNLWLNMHFMNKKLEVDHWNYSFYRLKRKQTRAKLVFLDFTAIWWPNYSGNSKIAKINWFSTMPAFSWYQDFHFLMKKWLQKWSKRDSLFGSYCIHYTKILFIHILLFILAMVSSWLQQDLGSIGCDSWWWWICVPSNRDQLEGRTWGPYVTCHAIQHCRDQLEGHCAESNLFWLSYYLLNSLATRWQ